MHSKADCWGKAGLGVLKAASVVVKVNFVFGA